jgi:NADH-quinone oxidoreductase subunit L
VQNAIYMQSLGIVLMPLLAAILAGFFGKLIGRKGSHSVTIAGVGGSFILSLILAKSMFIDKTLASTEISLYTWSQIGKYNFEIGFLIDEITIMMACVVTFVSLMVHIYTVGYMHNDPGYKRFFSYISLFTFAMLMLVMANNFLQLFFGWEAVGLVSYLLIGFWFKKETAIYANLKAFLVNRVGDFGFLLGIAAVLMAFGTLNYAEVFAGVSKLAATNPTIDILGYSHELFTVMCILLFIGAMGKSAQVPLHVWLPDSMEGPTPISALIHAATMVTAGIFMVTRLSPLFEQSDVALNFILIIGSVTCFFMGLIGIVQNDIKRIVAYSTLSQLGYMMVALGSSAYAIGMFHLVTHAFFKALLFLGAGSVIIAMHHEQDIQNMGALRKRMPMTYLTMFLGSLALIGFPFFSGFYSKDLIIEAVHHSNLPFANWAYYAVLSSVFVTALYSFRMFFLVFHTKPRMLSEVESHIKESPLVVWGPLALLAIPSVFSGIILVGPIFDGLFGNSIFVLDKHQSFATLQQDFHGATSMAWHGFTAKPFILAMLGVLCAFIGYVMFPVIPKIISKILFPLHKLLLNKYGFDGFNQAVFASGTRIVGKLFWKGGDSLIIDGMLVNGSAKNVGRLSSIMRHLQSGYIYHYSLAMVLGIMVLLAWLILH